jgi:hypothetical protein
VLMVALMRDFPSVANRLPLRSGQKMDEFGGIEGALRARSPCTPQTLPDFEAGTYHEGTIVSYRATTAADLTRPAAER